MRILNRSVDVEHKDSGEGIVRQVERLETVVVKSDRTVHTTVMTPAPKGTRFEDRVMRLTDGTLIDRAPTPNRYGSWSWHSIKAYLEGATKTRGLGAILRDVSAHLRSSVWLPHEEDYAILTLVVPVNYAQAIFDSVPLIFLHGPPGSGKSETGRAMARVAANAYVCGQSSAASIARFIDESRGLVVLDDLEAISSRSGEFGELSQALKLSYNRETAVKLWTDVKTMRTMRLNFFGVKMVNNTQGADHTLGSRMMRIQAQPIPNRIKEQFLGLAPTESTKLKALRDELHTWTFVNVALIEEKYRKLFPKNSDRACEIAAPLKVMASLADDPELRSMLDLALIRQDRKSLDVDDPVKVMREAIKNLIAQGYETVSITHVVLEMRYILSHAFGRSYLDAVSDWAQAEWAGRKLRSEGLIETGEACARRIRVWGSNLRFYRISRRHIDKVKASLAGEHIKPPAGVQNPQDFCRTCETCQYLLFPALRAGI